VNLFENPFYVLGVSTLSSVETIIQAVQEKSLLLDGALCTQHRTTLTVPRKRLAAEIAWLPGIPPAPAQMLVMDLEKSPETKLAKLPKLSPLCRCNTALAILHDQTFQTPTRLANWIFFIESSYNSIDSEELMRQLNADRSSTGFPLIQRLSDVNEALSEHKQFIKQQLRTIIQRSKDDDIVLTLVIQEFLHRKCQISTLIDDLISDYHLKSISGLNNAFDHAKQSIDKMKQIITTKSNPSKDLNNEMQIFFESIFLYNKLATPLQLYWMTARGQEHQDSVKLINYVREFYSFMARDYNLYSDAKSIVDHMNNSFKILNFSLLKLAEDGHSLEELITKNEVRIILDKISQTCSYILELINHNPSAGRSESEKLMRLAPSLLAQLSAKCLDTSVISQKKDEIALALNYCAVACAKNMSSWSNCILILDDALKYATKNDTKNAIIKNKEIAQQNKRVFDGLTPIFSAPSLKVVNGIGYMLYGSSDYDISSESYIATYYFVFFFIPLFPICRYRVISKGTEYRFLGKLPLRNFDKWHIAVFIGLALWFVISAFSSNDQQNRKQINPPASYSSQRRGY